MEVLYKIKFEKFNTVFHQEYTTIPVGRKIEKHVGNNIFELKDDYSIVEMGSEKHPLFKHKCTSTTEEDFEKNYGNPMCGVGVVRMTIVVERNEDKVAIKVFQYQKYRAPGRVYFTKSSKMMFVTYKFSTNELYSGSLINSFKKRKFRKSVRKNYFASKPISVLSVHIQNQLGMFKNTDNYLDSIDVIQNAVNSFLKEIPNFNNDFPYSVDENLYKHYLNLRNIKYPNNFPTYLNAFFPLPKKKLLEKSKYKLVDTFMLSNNLVGDKIRKILHTVEFINVNFYLQLEKLFGEKYLKNQDESIIKKIFENKNGYNIPVPDGFTDKERNNSFSVFKEILTNNDRLLYTFIDHIIMYNKLRLFESVRWRSTNIEKFKDEHNDWSDRYSHYTKGTYTRYYTEEFLNKLREPILGEYYPVVLTTSSEYNDESNKQSNCVKTYVDRCSSFCLSLRKGDTNGDERATIEYRIRRRDDGTLYFSRVQTLGRFNNRLSDEWNSPVENLDTRMDFLSKTIKIERPKVKVEIGNKSIESDSEFKEQYGLDWTSPYMRHIQPSYHHRIMDINEILEF
jgi:hypothetical protein